MQHNLHPEDRNILHRNIVRAREIAEEGLRAAMSTLAVGEPAPYEGMTGEQRSLRNALRAHARQLGDRREKNGAMTVNALVREGAYEHWHRMLFARFLAENDLLQHPKYQSTITLDEVADVAESEGFADAWEAAAHYATTMLPQIFRVDSPVFRLRLAPEHQIALERLLEELPKDVFTAADSLGWVYQFWQTARKDEVNDAEVKIGAEELPAVTQLFTEPYMVEFLLDNSLGAWWAERRLTAEDRQSASSEGELQEHLALPGVPLTFLRFVRDADVKWTPAGGTHPDRSESLSEFKLLDPCCGSGHFLVTAFRMLVPMRVELEKIKIREAVDRVLTENLFGLELDQRCVELAAFNLALAAWTFPDAGGYRTLPDMNIACSGQRIRASKQQWLGLAHRMADGALGVQESGLFPEHENESFWHSELKRTMSTLYDLFEDAPVLGSLIDPGRLTGDMFSMESSQVFSLLMEVLDVEHLPGDEREMGVAAEGIARAAQILAGEYHLVITNVPYLVRSKQDDVLRDYSEEHYPEAKNDLATVFLERCLELCTDGGNCSIVLPQNWLFLTTYRALREKLLKGETWNLIARLGAGGFQTPMWDFNVQLLSISDASPGSSSEAGSQNTGDGLIRGLDVSDQRSPEEKAKALLIETIKEVSQKQQLKNPDARIALDEFVSGLLLAEYCSNHQGLSTGDNPRFRRSMWEVANLKPIWEPEQSTVDDADIFGGRSGILMWEEGKGQLWKFGRENVKALHNVDRRGEEAWGKWGVGISQMQSLPALLYTGQKFDTNVAALIPGKIEDIPATWCFCSSPDYNDAVRRIDQKLNVTNATLVKVPFDLEHWTRVAEQQYPDGLPKPFSDDPTQWIFHGHPCGSVIWDEQRKWTAEGPPRTDETVLQVAVARLLGYRWPAELDEEMELADEQRAVLQRCDDLLKHADEDGIVCIPSVRGERTAAERIVELLKAAYGREWSNDTFNAILTSADAPGKSLDRWLRDVFFEQHCKLFHHRPFIWHIWDGRRHDGFHALVNYHKLAAGDGKGKKLLESLTYSYLGDWIARREADVKRGENDAEERLAAAQELRRRLEAVLKGEAPYDIFVRWKPLHQQAIGWMPDINDGVRMNIRPFMTSDIPGGRKGAGILRWKPNIKWTKDRGKEPERPRSDYPWFWDGDTFTGERLNDIHLTIEEKLKARGLEHESGT